LIVVASWCDFVAADASVGGGEYRWHVGRAAG